MGCGVHAQEMVGRIGMGRKTWAASPASPPTGGLLPGPQFGRRGAGNASAAPASNCKIPLGEPMS